MITVPRPKLQREGAYPRCPLPLPDSRYGHGFAHCLVAVAPMIHEARERVRRGASELAASHEHPPFNPSTIDEILASSLAPQILMMMARVMALELNVARLKSVLAGDTPEERFDSFVNQLREPDIADRLLSEYPVLGEQIANRLDRWAAFSIEFLQHLCDDWSALRQTLLTSATGMLTAIKGGAGDTHRDGRSVMVASFTSGARLVYKPRSLAVDQHFQTPSSMAERPRR